MANHLPPTINKKSNKKAEDIENHLPPVIGIPNTNPTKGPLPPTINETNITKNEGIHNFINYIKTTIIGYNNDIKLYDFLFKYKKVLFDYEYAEFYSYGNLTEIKRDKMPDEPENVYIITKFGYRIPLIKKQEKTKAEKQEETKEEIEAEKQIQKHREKIEAIQIEISNLLRPQPIKRNYIEIENKTNKRNLEIFILEEKIKKLEEEIVDLFNKEIVYNYDTYKLEHINIKSQTHNWITYGSLIFTFKNEDFKIKITLEKQENKEINVRARHEARDSARLSLKKFLS